MSAVYCDPEIPFSFSINGVPAPLRGVARHQDRLAKGNALTAEGSLYEDAMLIKELVPTPSVWPTIQHSQDFYDACDERGLRRLG